MTQRHALALVRLCWVGITVQLGLIRAISKMNMAILS